MEDERKQHGHIVNDGEDEDGEKAVAERLNERHEDDEIDVPTEPLHRSGSGLQTVRRKQVTHQAGDEEEPEVAKV